MNTLTERLDGLVAQKKDERGFTLVELLVVILIIGILAAIAIPAFLNQRQRANDAAVESDIRNVAMTVETMTTSIPNPNSITVTSHEGGTGAPLIASIAIPSTDFVRVNVDGDEETVVISGDVRVEGEGDAQGFTLYGTHTNGRQYNLNDDTWAEYDSNLGGLQKEALNRGGGNPGGDEGNEDENGDGGGDGGVVLQCDAYEQAFWDFLNVAQGLEPDAMDAFYVPEGSGWRNPESSSIYFTDNNYNEYGQTPYNGFDDTVLMASIFGNWAGGLVTVGYDTYDSTSCQFGTDPNDNGGDDGGDDGGDNGGNEGISQSEVEMEVQDFWNWVISVAPGSFEAMYDLTPDGSVRVELYDEDYELIEERSDYTGFHSSIESVMVMERGAMVQVYTVDGQEFSW